MKKKFIISNLIDKEDNFSLSKDIVIKNNEQYFKLNLIKNLLNLIWNFVLWPTSTILILLFYPNFAFSKIISIFLILLIPTIFFLIDFIERILFKWNIYFEKLSKPYIGKIDPLETNNFFDSVKFRNVVNFNEVEISKITLDEEKKLIEKIKKHNKFTLIVEIIRIITFLFFWIIMPTFYEYFSFNFQ